ncbi:ribosome [Ascochyta rabiei]|uniref:Ribosome n=1 Tax=Didymella rabiei TaxID=5454 RepID=A0A163CWE8_DIDRA|nr:ribosome [Ascochyta rabiei]
MTRVEAVRSLRISQGIFSIVNFGLASYPKASTVLTAFNFINWAATATFLAYLNTLGDRLADRYSESKTTEDLAAIISTYQSALQQSNPPVLDRISGGRNVLRYHAVRSDWQRAYEDTKISIGLVPRLTDWAPGKNDKQYVLGQIFGLASDATAVAMSAGQAPSVALSLLEQGRSVLAAFLREIRTDIGDLQAKHPDLASDFIRFRGMLDVPATKEMTASQEDGQPASRDVTSMRSRTGLDFDNLLVKIREQAGFEDFQLSPSEEDMKASARCRPIVVIDVSELRPDAILVEPSEIRCVALPLLRTAELEEMGQQGDRGSPAILERLWVAVTEPILDALGYTEPVSGDNWPQIWWILTGKLSKLPLHAAGHRGLKSIETVLDRAMSP